ncbi:MAG TPA: nucleoside 2-deoxyribosyltransferase [Acetobacteraceae bacterium]|nr:nucleoside 2-deoxyribosyltransferase [Acetobacteraceae bacterium]
MRVYLAGPEVFLRDAAAIGAAKRAICARHGLAGVFPTDPHPDLAGAPPGAAHLYRQNEAHLHGCDALIANLTPFRGPSADAGTVFELGLMRGLGRTCFGYAAVAGDFAARTLAFLGPRVRRRGDGAWEDEEGMAVEEFGLADNLMIEEGIRASGGMLLLGPPAPWRDLALFERCVERAAAVLRGRSGPCPDAAP